MYVISLAFKLLTSTSYRSKVEEQMFKSLQGDSGSGLRIQKREARERNYETIGGNGKRKC